MSAELKSLEGGVRLGQARNLGAVRPGSWLTLYLGSLTVVAVLTTVGFARSCPRVDGYGLTQGCGHTFLVTPWSSYLLNGLLVVGIVTAVGTAITLTRRRRPGMRSLAVWVSTGFLIVGLSAVGGLPVYLGVLTLLSLSISAVLAITAGIWLAGVRGSGGTALG